MSLASCRRHVTLLGPRDNDEPFPWPFLLNCDKPYIYYFISRGILPVPLFPRFWYPSTPLSSSLLLPLFAPYWYNVMCCWLTGLQLSCLCLSNRHPWLLIVPLSWLVLLATVSTELSTPLGYNELESNSRHWLVLMGGLSVGYIGSSATLSQASSYSRTRTRRRRREEVRACYPGRVQNDSSFAVHMDCQKAQHRSHNFSLLCTCV